MVLGCDVESTGLDTFHGCLPYLVTTCDSNNQHRVWEWPVNPKNRRILVDEKEVKQIQEILDSSDKLVFHNAKFDMKMLNAIGVKIDHLWGKVEDTLFIAHMLASQSEHDLTSVVKEYLHRDITPYEDKMEKCVQEARRWCRSHLKEWKLASEGIEDEDGSQLMPSTKGSNDKSGRAWMADTWLPKAVALHEGPSWVKGHQNEDWLMATDDYADIDSSCLIPLYEVLMREVERRKLTKIYRERLKILPVINRMEHHGTTYKLDTHVEMKREFTDTQSELEKILHGIAECYDYQLELPTRGRNQNLDTFVFEILKLPILAWTEPSKKRKSNTPFVPKPKFDADIKEEYESILPSNTMQQRFIKTLNEKGEYDTALGYMVAYERFCIKDKNHVLLTPSSCRCGGNVDNCSVCGWGLGICSICNKAESELDEPCIDGNYSILHPNINPTGTVGLRMSHTNPNSANVSKHKKTNLRKCFGPRDGRIWYSLDYTNIELVIPAFETDEKELVSLFTNPDGAPFYGSFHMVMFSTLWSDLWSSALAKYGPEGVSKFCKAEYEDTYYGYTKNFDFGTQYGQQERKANITAHHPNAFKLKATRFPKIDGLAKKLIREAERNNCVTTIPDKTVDPDRGFPIMAKRSKWGKVEPTTPLCYHVSSTAAQVLNKAMVLCDNKLIKWRADGFDAHMILTIHDELVFDFSQKDNPVGEYIYTDSKANELRTIMESASNGIGIPIRVSVDRHKDSWADGECVQRGKI